MLAVTADSINPDEPLAGLGLGQIPDPDGPDGWVPVAVRAAALNHHDLWTLKGVGISPDRLPIVLGCDAAGLGPQGEEVVVHAVIGDPAAGGGDETLDPKRSLLSEVHDGTLAERVWVPSRNILPKPPGWSFEQAACVPTAWLTAYRMLGTRGRLEAGETILVQGAGGGVSTALVVLGRAMGLRVWATSRDAGRREKARELGAHDCFEPGARLPERVDAVMESVGAATWSHSLKALRPGGRVVVCGATSGAGPAADLNRIYFLQLSVIGSTMGTRTELAELLEFMVAAGVDPLIDSVFELAQARDAFERLAGGEAFGKIVLSV